MTKIFIVLSIVILPIFAKVNIVVSIVPQVKFVKLIGGDRVDVALMVEAGNSPHTYEPKPSQMKDISKADIYFSIGVEFEEAWLGRFANQNADMKIVDTSFGITKTSITHHNKHIHSHSTKDPHI